MPRKVFVAGEILTAADVNTNLMDQAVMVFDDSAARGSAIPSPSEGMVTYLKDTDALEKFDGSNFVDAAPEIAGIGSNVVQTVKTDTFTSTSSTYTAITGLQASITPTTDTSKVLVIATINGHMGVPSSASAPLLRIARSGANSPVATDAGSRGAGSTTLFLDTFRGQVESSIFWLDSPATTSAVTYNVETARLSAGTICINRSQSDTDNNLHTRSTSSLLLIEVVG